MTGATVEIGEQGVNETERLCRAPQGAAWGQRFVRSLSCRVMLRAPLGAAQVNSGSMKRSRGANASALS